MDSDYMGESNLSIPCETGVAREVEQRADKRAAHMHEKKAELEV